MNDNAQKLYIPVNVLETHDLVPGMGGKEFAAMGIAAAIGVVISILKYSLQGTTQGNGLTGGVPPVRFSM